jgi:hypothetical protein
VASKFATRAQAEARKAAASRFAENVLGDSDKASDIEDEDLDSWIARKGIELVDNTGKRSLKMANSGNGDPRTKAELLDEIDSLQQQVDDLCDTLDSIADLAGSGPSGDDDDDDEDDDDDDPTAAGAYDSD